MSHMQLRARLHGPERILRRPHTEAPALRRASDGRQRRRIALDLHGHRHPGRSELRSHGRRHPLADGHGSRRGLHGELRPRLEMRHEQWRRPVARAGQRHLPRRPDARLGHRQHLAQSQDAPELGHPQRFDRRALQLAARCSTSTGCASSCARAIAKDERAFKR